MPRFTVTRDGARATITFDDGGMNLLSSEALRELDEALQAARGRSHEDDDAISSQPATGNPRLVVFRSARPKLFAAGADMAEMQHFTAGEAETFARLGQDLFASIEKLPCVTVAVIDGDCFGGALDLALAFDLRFSTPRSRFSHPGARLGIITGFGGTSRWRKLLDRAAARQLFLGNQALSAEEALAAGVVDRVGESFEEELTRLQSLDPGLTRFVKELAPRAERLTESQLRDLARHLGALYGIVGGRQKAEG